MLDRASLMKSTLCRHVGSMRLSRRIKKPDMHVARAYLQFRAPLASLSVPTNAEQTGREVVFSGSPLVLGVNSWRRLTNILDPVVGPVSVDVVKDACRPSAVDIEPSKAMRAMSLIVDGDNQVSVPACPANGLASLPSETRYASCENSGLGIVVNKFAQALRGKIGLSHDALQMLIGQRLVGVISTVPASLF